MATDTNTDTDESTFDTDTRVTQVGEGTYSAVVSDRWNIGKVPNGGYTMAMAARALAETLSLPDPISVTGFYFEPTRPGDCDISIEVVKAGGTTAMGVARVFQNDVECARYVGNLGHQGESRRQTRLMDCPPDLPDIEDCVPFRFHDGVTPQIIKQLDMRIPPEAVGWTMGQLSDKAELGGWIRFADGREPDPLSMLFFADAFPPPVFAMLGMQGWVPTLNLSVQVRGRPAPGWLRAWFRTRFITDGYLEEDGEIWDSEGNLVALSRQLAMLWRLKQQ